MFGNGFAARSGFSVRGLTFELSGLWRRTRLAAEGMMPPAPEAAKRGCRSGSALEREVRPH